MLCNKEMIKAKWGAYVDTDKLVDDMMALLTKYDHRNSEYGVCKIIDKYFTNKEPLIKMISKSESYAGDLRIILKVPFVRDCVRDEICKFIDKMRTNPKVKDCILKYKDENGKTLYDYINTGVMHMSLKNMKKAPDVLHSANVSKFNPMNGALRESAEKADRFDTWMHQFRYEWACHTVPRDLTYDEVSVKSGMKMSRAFNRVCTHYGVDKWRDYNREFAKYADMVASNERTLNFIISVNPLDYLTMSFGKSWASCHTIDQRNRRRMANGYHGAYCNGTLSYMLDKSSFITYVLEDLDGDLCEKGKLYRNMFHVNIDTCKFVQGRIYPQGNDGSTDLYAKFRQVVQKEFTGLMGLSDDKWKVKAVSDYDDTESYGTHYKDYSCQNDCRVFYPNEKGNNGRVAIGTNDIYCPHCGTVTDYYDRLSCYGDSCSVPVETVEINTERVEATLGDSEIQAILDSIPNNYTELRLDANDLRTITIDRSAIYTGNWNYVTVDSVSNIRIDTVDDDNSVDSTAWTPVNGPITFTI